MDRKVMLLTGGSRGIGRAISIEAVKRGWFVSMGVRQPSALSDKREVASGDAEVVGYDASEGHEAGWVEGVVARRGRIDAVVACAGIFDPESIVTRDDARVVDLFEVNFHAPRRLAAAAWDALVSSGNGRVIIMGSLSGKRVKSARMGLYSTSKFAAVGLAHALRHEGWDHGIRATAICPGLVATDMGVAAGSPLPPETFTQPEDVARLTLDTIEQPPTLSQAEITLNCQPDGIF